MVAISNENPRHREKVEAADCELEPERSVSVGGVVGLWEGVGRSGWESDSLDLRPPSHTRRCL